MLGYPLPRNFEPGVGWMYVVTRTQTVRNNSVMIRTHHAYGPLLFLQKRLPISRQDYFLLYTDIAIISYRPSRSVRRDTYLMQHLGVGIGAALGKKFHLFALFLYNPAHSEKRSPYADAKQIRIGARL